MKCKSKTKSIKIDLGDGLSANISPENLEELNINTLPVEGEEIEKEDITA